MWLSAETMIVPSGQGFVAACGLRAGDSGTPTISGISRTKPSITSSLVCVIYDHVILA
jgi:hypothetical protein